MALCFDAFAWSLVPSNAMCHSFTKPARRQSVKTCYKQVDQRGQMLLTEVTDRPEIRPLVRRQHLNDHVLVQFLDNLARGGNPHSVGIAQHLHQQLGMVGSRSTGDAPIGLENGCQVQFLHEIQQEIRQVRLGQPLLRRWGQQPQRGA